MLLKWHWDLSPQPLLRGQELKKKQMKSSLQGIWLEQSLDLYKNHTASNFLFQ
jgi:hypothetical protein